MKKQIGYSVPLILAVIPSVALLLTSLSFAAYSNSLTEITQFSYITGGISYPSGRVKSGGQSRAYRQSFKLKIPEGSRSLSQITVDVPKGLSVRGKVEVSDDSQQKLNGNIENNSRGIIITFQKPISSGTTLNIDMKDVHISGVTNAWLYPVSGRFADLDAEIPIGVVRIGLR